MYVYLIDINVSAEIDEYPSLRFQDIRKKPKCHGRTHGWTDNVKTVYPTTNKVCGEYKKHFAPYIRIGNICHSHVVFLKFSTAIFKSSDSLYLDCIKLNWLTCFCRSFVCVCHWRVSICSYIPDKKSLKAAWILNLLRHIIAASRDTEHSAVATICRGILMNKMVRA